MDPKRSDFSMSRDMDKSHAEIPLDLRPGASLPRRSFMKGIGAAGLALSTGAVVNDTLHAEEKSGALTTGDAAILRFLAAAELIETDLWQQYAELGGSQTNEPPMITGLTGGNAAYIKALSNLDGDMDTYIHDNAEDEFSHAAFINAYLKSKKADTVNLDRFRTLPSSQATGAQQIGRLTNLMELTIDTSWFTRYRSRTQNPDLGDSFANAIAVLGTKRHTAIPRGPGHCTQPGHQQRTRSTLRHRTRCRTCTDRRRERDRHDSGNTFDAIARPESFSLLYLNLSLAKLRSHAKADCPKSPAGRIIRRLRGRNP